MVCIPGHDHRLICVIVRHLQPADGLEGEALLKYYAEKWVRYEMGAKAADSAFMHHRKWVMYRRQEGNTEILPTYQVDICRLFSS